MTFAGVVGLPEDIIEGKHWNTSGAPLEATNVVHQSPVKHVQKHGTAVVAATEYLFVARKSTYVLDVVTGDGTAPTGNYTVTVDVQKYSGGSWASILNGGSQTIDSTATADEAISLVLSGTAGVTTLAAGEWLRVVRLCRRHVGHPGPRPDRPGSSARATQVIRRRPPWPSPRSTVQPRGDESIDPSCGARRVSTVLLCLDHQSATASCLARTGGSS